MHRALTCFTVAAVLLPGAAPSAAQQRPDSAAADTVRLRPVEVNETRAAATVGGASAIIVRTEALRASPAPLLEDALRESPFVHVRQNSRGEMELSVRGSDSRQAAVLMDGVPLSLGWDHRVDPSLVPLTGAQNLVIVRGLSSVLSGPNTLGGTIEVSHDDAFGRLDRGRVFGGAGVDESGAYVVSLGGGRQFPSDVGSVTARAGFSHRDRDGFTLAGGVADPTASAGLRTNSDLRETDMFATLRWSGTMGRSLGAMLSAFDATRGVPPEEHLTEPRLWRYPYNRRAVVALSGSAGTFATPLGYATLDAGVGVNAGRLRIESYADRTYQTVDHSEMGAERTLTGRARFTHTLPAGATLAAAVTAATVDYRETFVGDPSADYRQRLLSAGTELEIPAGASTVAVGVVADRAATPITGGRAAQPAMQSLGWRAGVTRAVGQHWQLHGSANRRSRFPSLRELYSGALDRFVPNPDLKPETLLGLEAGATVDRQLGFLPDATLQVNVFHHRLDDAVVRTTLAAPDNRFLRVNRDRIVSTGTEVMAGAAYGARDRQVTLTGDVMVQRIRVVGGGSGAARHSENNPEVRAMVELGVPVIARIRGFANARHTGRQYCLDGETDAEVALDPRTETSLALERRFELRGRGAVRSVRALLALDNAANAAVYDQCGLPQPGRTLRLMLSFR